MNKKTIVVIGGGPAGMMAAIVASQPGQDEALLAEPSEGAEAFGRSDQPGRGEVISPPPAGNKSGKVTSPLPVGSKSIADISAPDLTEVILIEKNPTLGKKLLLTGKSRCNLTNACDIETLLAKFHKNGRFLRAAFNTFSNTDLMQFFESRGLSLKVERQLRVFPATDISNSVLEVLKKELAENRVRVVYNAQLDDILVQDGRVRGVVVRKRAVGSRQVGTDMCVCPNNEAGRGRPACLPSSQVAVADSPPGRGQMSMPSAFSLQPNILCDSIILASGGISYGFTGSTGDGLRIAEQLGHHIVPLRPGLVPLRIKGHLPGLLEGLTLKNIQLAFKCGKQQIISEVGELLFTGFGVSGPLILSLSGQIVDWLNNGGTVSMTIDLKPGMSGEQLDARFLREFGANPRKSIKSILKFFLPQRMVDVFIEIAVIPQDKQVSQINKDERQRLAALFKGWQLEVSGALPIEQAMITRGGISLKDINPQTMESRIVKGLYFAGEMVDIDADTGGFNLQAAFSTGYLAGQSARRDIHRRDAKFAENHEEEGIR